MTANKKKDDGFGGFKARVENDYMNKSDNSIEKLASFQKRKRNKDES